MTDLVFGLALSETSRLAGLAQVAELCIEFDDGMTGLAVASRKLAPQALPSLWVHDLHQREALGVASHSLQYPPVLGGQRTDELVLSAHPNGQANGQTWRYFVQAFRRDGDSLNLGGIRVSHVVSSNSHTGLLPVVLSFVSFWVAFKSDNVEF